MQNMSHSETSDHNLNKGKKNRVPKVPIVSSSSWILPVTNGTFCDIFLESSRSAHLRDFPKRGKLNKCKLGPRSAVLKLYGWSHVNRVACQDAKLSRNTKFSRTRFFFPLVQIVIARFWMWHDLHNILLRYDIFPCNSLMVYIPCKPYTFFCR